MATLERNGIGKDCGATVAHGEDAAGKPRANFTDDDGVQRFTGPAGVGMATEATQLLVKTAAEKVATEVVVGQGLPARAFIPPAPGGTPEQQDGTTGLINVDWAETYGAGGPVGTWHPRVNGVRIIETLGAGVMAATAVGRTITITNVNVGVSTIANIIAAIAAAPTVVPLVVLTGAGIVGAAYAGNAGHDLEEVGTIPANAAMALWPDGYWRPKEVDNTGGLKSSQSSLAFFEDASRGVARVERQGTETGRSAASAIVVAAGTTGRILGHVLEAGAGGATFNVRKDAVIGGTIIAQFILAANAYDMRDWPDWPYGNGLYCEIVAGGGAFNFVVR